MAPASASLFSEMMMTTSTKSSTAAHARSVRRLARRGRHGCVCVAPAPSVIAKTTTTSPSSSSSNKMWSAATSAHLRGRGHRRRSGDVVAPAATSGDDGEDQRLAGSGNVVVDEDEDEDEDDVESKDAVDASSPIGDLISSPLFYVTFGVVGGVAIVRQFENAALLLSALPIVGLTALSKTDFGTRLQDSIEERRPALDAAAAEAEKKRAAARASSPFYGPERPMYLPRALSFDGAAYAPHLTGELSGDYGFDPLGLSADPESLDRNQELELLHARWAMLGMVGVVVPELLTDVGALPLAEPVWWKVGAAKLNGESLNYLGVGGFVIAGKQGIAVIAACQAVLMGGPEYARSVGIRSLEPVGVYLPGDKNYPGGAPFDPLKLSDDAEAFEWQRVAEIKHGRMAMVAMAGCFAQAFVTREGPWANLRDFLSDPAHATVFSPA